jgi:hypothetical protein
MKPATEIVVLNISEQITFGEDANKSNPFNYNDAKENSFDEVEEEEDGTDEIRYVEFKSIWENEKKYIE